MYKTKLLAVITFLFFIFSNAYAQDRTIDSLKKEILNPKIHDTLKLSKIANLIDQIPSNSHTSDVLTEMMGEIASKNLKKTNSKDLQKKYTQYLAIYYGNLSSMYEAKRDVVKTLEYADKSIALFKSTEDYYEMNYTIVNKGIFYSHINEYEKAISCLFTALKYFEKNKKENQEGISYVNSVIGTVYIDQGEYLKAIEFFKKTIKYFENRKDPNGNEKYTLGMVYINCGSSYLLLKKYPEAVSYFNKALALSQELGDYATTSVILNKLAQVKMEEKEFEESDSLLRKALETDPGELSKANTYINLGDLYYRKKEFIKSESFLEEGFSISKKINNLQLQEKSSNLLFKVYKENNNFKKALEVYEFQNKLQDSSNVEASKNALAQQQIKYDFQKKQLNLELNAEKKTAAKNNWLIALSGVLLLVVLGGYFYYRNNKQKQKITILEKDRIKQKLLLSQMNPHFIFNSIDNIQSLIINGKENVAVSYLNSFSKLTRQILENSNENYISLQEEIDMVENYLSIQQLLYNDRFNYSINIANISDTESYFIPPMLTQPFIENAIKHGIRNKDEKGMIEIAFSFSQEKLFFEIMDNGLGFNAEKKQSGHKSMAMKITKERLLNYTQNKNFEVRSENKVDAEGNIQGANIIFEIPYIHEN
ncbi:Tetratricopeptide repeat-containing protein [Chryseobacterium jejuense]|uniref:Probable sensor-like histidine kinase YehU n=1 Tax=Chryseobacterium jejuense TaxID=445960 RepID=A0A2X2X8G6_CHRJE|nr:Tetratricopeptide repeat-containing protein [Chryseobacterium jejuense]SQB46453.1 Probable sensor-like histidine kinase YehU [Chryseobacterium jejuense]